MALETGLAETGAQLDAAVMKRKAHRDGLQREVNRFLSDRSTVSVELKKTRRQLSA